MGPRYVMLSAQPSAAHARDAEGCDENRRDAAPSTQLWTRWERADSADTRLLAQHRRNRRPAKGIFCFTV